MNGSLASLKQGRIAVADETAEKRGLKVGDTVPIEYMDKAKGRLTVGAIYEESEFVSPS